MCFLVAIGGLFMFLLVMFVASSIDVGNASVSLVVTLLMFAGIFWVLKKIVDEHGEEQRARILKEARERAMQENQSKRK